MDQKANGVEPGMPVDPAAGANFRAETPLLKGGFILISRGRT
jgi:hypothetical protein